jgi:hypothetical protein
LKSNSKEQPAFTAAEPSQSVECMQSVTRPEHRVFDPRRLRGGKSFSAPVKETGL